MKRNLIYLALFVILTAVLAGCGGHSTPITPPDGFDKLTARLVGGDGQPLVGVSVRVEGHDTGVTTDANGSFSLPASAFPNGADASNQMSFGRGGFVIGTMELVPATDPDPEIKFDPPNPGTGGEGTGSISGHVYENSADASGNLTPLADVEVTLFSIDLGGVYQTTTDADGAYSFADIAAGHWQMTANLAGYHPEMAMIVLGDGVDLVYDFGLTPEGGIPEGEGIVVRGTLTDSKTSAPIGGAFISCMADTGYMGMPETGVYNDVTTMETGPVPGVAGGSDGTRSSSCMPFMYDPQYQETTTNADGTFEFPNPVVGYSIWMNYYADGYLNGSHYESIDGVENDLDLALTLDPIIPTDISGTIVDENGDPIEGAYVEFIFSMGGIGPLPMDMAVPAGMDLEQMAADGTASREDFGTPPPPSAAGNSPDSYGGWDAAMAPAAGGAGESDSGSGADNTLMQRYRFEHQNRGASADEPFDGYYSATTGPDGTYTFEDVPAGSYWVFASAYKHLPYNAEFTAVEDPAENVLDIELPNIPVGIVEGTLTDEDGNPVDDALVTCTQPFVDPYTYSDAAGHYRIENVPAGDWIISAYKEGYLTESKDVSIPEDQVASCDLTLTVYETPQRDTIAVYGTVFNGNDNTGIGNASMVFTPTDPTLGSYYRHVFSNDAGEYATDLIASMFDSSGFEPNSAPSTEYNLLIQAEGFEDLYTRIYVDANWPSMDYWLWPAGAMNGRGWVPGGGGVVPPSGGGTDPGTGGGGGSEPGGEPMPPDPMPL